VSPAQAGLPVQCPFCNAVISTPVATARSGPANAGQDFANAIMELIGGIALLLIAFIWLADSPVGKFVGLAGLFGIGHATKKLKLW
jgi:hypothetical protein